MSIDVKDILEVPFTAEKVLGDCSLKEISNQDITLEGDLYKTRRIVLSIQDRETDLACCYITIKEETSRGGIVKRYIIENIVLDDKLDDVSIAYIVDKVMRHYVSEVVTITHRIVANEDYQLNQYVYKDTFQRVTLQIVQAYKATKGDISPILERLQNPKPKSEGENDKQGS